jgi:hypothetical protein
MTETPPSAPEAPASPRHGPLQGVRVLDLTTVVMGPAATQILGDLGADVIKVEAPEGDSMRRVGPFRHAGMGPLYLQANRNKRSIVLDLKQAADRELLLELAGSVDVLVSNIRPQAMARLGLAPETLCARHPRLVYASAVGFGAGGPEAGRAVYDDLIQAVGGVAGLFQAIDGAPRYAPINVADRVVGLHLVIAILAALQHRHATGEGQVVTLQPNGAEVGGIVETEQAFGTERVEHPGTGPGRQGRQLSRDPRCRHAAAGHQHHRWGHVTSPGSTTTGSSHTTHSMADVSRKFSRSAIMAPKSSSPMWAWNASTESNS